MSRVSASLWIKSAFVALFFIVAAVAGAAGFSAESLEIRLADGRAAHFTVEIAATSDQRALGLMNRDAMAQDRGMLFDFGESRPVYMWMKNTYIPLDMLFLSEDGRITHIHPDALPLSENIIDSHGNVRFVIELNGGLAAKLGIKVGDTAISNVISRAARK